MINLKALCSACMIAFIALNTHAMAGELDEAAAAIQKADQKSGIRILLPLANRGDQCAQWLLGTVYFVGNADKRQNETTVPRDITQSVAWYKKAAVQGEIDSMQMLGFAYASGQGVERADPFKAHIWLNLTVIRSQMEDIYKRRCAISVFRMGADSPPNLPFIRQRLRDIDSKLSQEQISDARQMIKKCNEANLKLCE